MPYDPKRPRPVLDDDAPAPVEALITSELPVIEPEPEPDPVVVVESVPEPAAGPEPVVTGSAAPAASTPGSDVPLAPAPDTPTANRAVAVTSLVAAVLSALVLVWLWRRRR